MPRRMPIDIACAIRAMHQVSHMKVRDIARRPEFRAYSRASIYRNAKIPLGVAMEDGRRNNKGRPAKLTARDKRRILQQLRALRRLEGPFSSKRLQLAAGLEHAVSNRTFRRYLHQAGYRYRLGKLLHSHLTRPLPLLFCIFKYIG